MREIDSSYVYEDQRRIARSGSAFDRVAFAMRALRILRPRGLTVAVREGRWELRIDRGKAWGAAPGEQWAVVSIPPDATREDIAIALAGLAGVPGEAFVLDVLIGTPEPH